MKKEIINNSNLHFEHIQWGSELAFWKDELKSFNNRLDELINDSDEKEVLVKLEHYQNQFIIHEEIIQSLKHDIDAHEINMSALDAKGEDALDRTFVMKHIEFRQRMEPQRHIYAELKKEFYLFLTKVMQTIYF